MINANILGVIECTDEYFGNTDYRILLSINALGEFSPEQLNKIDTTLNKLYGYNSKYEQKNNISITNLNYFADGAEYLLPYDINVLIEVLELFTYGEGTNAFLGDEFVTKEQLSGTNRKNFIFYLAEFIKNSIIDLREQERMKEEELKKMAKSLEDYFTK